MAEKTLSSLDQLQKKLAELKKTIDIQDKSERAKKKRKKKANERKLKKKKHKKQKSRKLQTRKLKRKGMKTQRDRKKVLKKKKQRKHNAHKKRVREKKKTLKTRRVARKGEKKEPESPHKEPLKEDARENIPIKQEPILKPKLENPVEEEVEDKMEEKKDEEKEEAEEEKEEKPKQPEQTERPEPPENLDKELEKLLKEKPEPMKKSKAPPESEKKKKDPDLPEKKGVLSLPFKVKINLPGRKKKEKDIEEVRKEGKKEVAKKKIALDKIELTGKSRSEMIKQLIVADVMSTDPITVKPDDKLSFVVRLFSNKKISGAPVVVEHNIVGLISKSDIVKVIGIKDVLDIDTPAFEKLENSKVSDVMKKKVYFVRKYNKLSEAADIMNKNDINLLPVVDNKKRIIGIVSRGDIVRVVSKELLAKLVQQQRQAMKKMTKIETDIDTVLDMVEQAGSISILEISERMTIHEDRIEDWAKTMEKEGLLEIFYPAFGSPVLRKKLRKDVISFEEEES